MSKTTSSKRAFAASVVSLALCFVMLLGTTFAWFTASTSTLVNTITSGNLKIDLVDGTGEDASSLVGKTLSFVDASDAAITDDVLWEPNCTYTVQDVYVKNTGNVDLKFKIAVLGIAGDDSLADVITWTVDGIDIDTAEFELEAGETYSSAISLTGTMDKNAGNRYMNKTSEGVAIAVYATQNDVEAEYAEVVGLIKELDTSEITGVALDTAYTLTTTDNAPEAAYADWDADFVVTFDQDIAAGAVTLAGAYDEWNNGAWVSFQNPVPLEAGTEFRLLKDSRGSYITYEEVCERVNNFSCGAASDVSGLTMTVELRLYEGHNAAETGEYITAGTYTYTF